MPYIYVLLLVVAVSECFSLLLPV